MRPHVPSGAAHAPAYFGPFPGRCGWFAQSDRGAAGPGATLFFANIISVMAWEELKTKVESIQAPETLSCCIPWAETILPSDILPPQTSSCGCFQPGLPSLPECSSKDIPAGTYSRLFRHPRKKRHRQRWLQGLHCWSSGSDSTLPMQGAQVGSLVQELRPSKAIWCSQKE